MMISCHEMMVLWHEMMISCHEMTTLMDGWAWYPPTKFLLSREIPYLPIPIPHTDKTEAACETCSLCTKRDYLTFAEIRMR